MGLTKSAAVPPGYKQTEVGVIPEDWEVKTAEQVCELIVDCKNRTPPVVEGGDFAVVRTPNVRNGRFVKEELRFTDGASFRAWTARAVPKLGDILITREAPLGEVCLVPAGLPVCLGQRMMLYRPDTGKVDSQYLLNSLMSSGVRQSLLKKIGGSTVGHAKVDDIRYLQVPVPPTITEQQAIAEALSDADALIEGLEALIAKKRQLKQGVMQELLRPSDNWLEKRLGEICNPSKERFSPTQGATERKCVELEHISSGTGSLLGFTSTSSLKSQKAIFRKGDVLFGKLRPYLKKYWLAAFDGVCSTEIWVLQTGSSIFSGWLYWLMQTDDVIDAANKSTGTKMPRAEWSTMKQTTIFVPPTLEAQIRIATILSDMDAEIAVLEGKLAKARRVKAGMMQDLLTGRVRLI